MNALLDTKDDGHLTVGQLISKYNSTGEHPFFTAEKYEMAGSPEQYWHWVRDSLAEAQVTLLETTFGKGTKPALEEINLTANQLMVRYGSIGSTGEHPRFPRKDHQQAIEEAKINYDVEHWNWVRDQIAEDFSANSSIEEIRAAMVPDEGDCQSCEDDKCVTGPECVVLENPAIPGTLHGVRVNVEDGKYSVIMASDGHTQALIDGKPWPGQRGINMEDPLVKALARELHEARVQLVAQDEQFAKSNLTIKNLLEALETLRKETPWPVEKMTPAVEEVLSLMNFRTGPIAHVYQKVGYDIQKKCEAEQAFVLHRFLGYALKHGDNWKHVAEAELQRMGAPTYNKVAVPEQDITPVNDGKIILPGQS